MKSQEKMILEKTFIKNNQENNIKKSKKFQKLILQFDIASDNTND